MKTKYTLLLLLFITVCSFAQQPYYDDVNLTLTGTALRDELATKIINTHTNSLTYSNIWDASRITDLDPNNSNNVVLIYGWEGGTDGDVTNDLSRNKFDNGGSNGDWNREHTFANSLANPDLDASGTSGPPYADAHNLRPSDVQRNGQRGNRKFADGSGNSGIVGSDWYPGDDSTGGTDWRGDVARITMYMYLRYGSQCLPRYNASGTTNTVDSDMINLLLDWNAADPVSEVEDARNTYHDGANTYSQGNRNPFIDNPYLATVIWGGTPAEDRWGTAVEDNENPTTPNNLVVSNETSSTIDVSWNASSDNIGVTAYDVYVDDIFNSSTSSTSTTITGLTAETTYSFTVLAKDNAGNQSPLSSSINGTTTAAAVSGSTCASETFENLGSNASNYTTRTWTGDSGLEWTATDARTDQSLNGGTVTVRNGELTSSIAADGIGELTVTTQLVFSGSSGNFDVLVNGTSVGSIPYSSTIQTTTLSNIDIEGDVSIVLDKTGNSNRVSIDDLSWTCYSALGIDDELLSTIEIYPNPTFGKSLTISTTVELSVKVFNSIGETVIIDSVSNNNNQIDISSLKTGIYLIKLESDLGSTTRKFIKK
ncbi:endonuclease [Urechidicola croceus]|uniref:Fibronectin type-III domain-containing protein n=1 Tax=Urechidicola croceus TaxID=1850246 RepID=A0A1D8P4X1_9FLAO|nr:endonuclease [Urechidicola croceus]AOW19617.1 hypothetical protein LPB138_02505 [Urechidicola croceus]